MPKSSKKPLESSFLLAARNFWYTYYAAIERIHRQEGRSPTEPIRDRNLSTTDAKHVATFEQFCQRELAGALGLPPCEVGKRKIHFRSHRSKSFDVCWPLKGDPKILISVKSMQNAYRNFTNRIEEAIGDSAVLRLYQHGSAFGFFFFMVDGPVARGQAESVKPPKRLDASGVEKATKGANIHLALIEQGGDFFDLSRADQFRCTAAAQARKSSRKDVIKNAQLTLLDFLAENTKPAASIHYDAVAFVPALIKRTGPANRPEGWEVSRTPVDPRLALPGFFEKLVRVAQLRGLI